MTDFFYIQVPADLRVLHLPGPTINKNQLEQINKCTNLLKLDISNCMLTHIPNLKKLTQLRILYLHQNQITALQLESLANCQDLNYLTLFLNPISAQGSLRKKVLAQIKSLWAFDFNAVTDEERYKSLNFKPIQEKSRLPWPIISLKDQDVLQVWQELAVIRKVWQKCSVILTIQKCIKSYLTRKKYKSLVMKQIRIQAFVKSVVKHWITFTKNKKDLHQMFAHQYQDQFAKVKIMVTQYRQRKGKAIKEQKSARIIFRSLRKNLINHKNIMEQIGPVFRLYFPKDQLSLFKTILDRFRKRADVKGIIDSNTLLYEDFQKANKIYESEVFTYRLPNQCILQNNPQFFRNMLTYAASQAKISCCLQQLKLSIIRKWASITKYSQEANAYLYLQKYDELMPARKPYSIMYKLSKLDRQKYEKKLIQINRFQQREYRQLLMISLSKEIISPLVKAIILHNKENPGQLFITIFEKQLKEAVAALKIQRQFRSYIDIKKNGKSLQSIINILVKERSLLIIQKWFKAIKWYHRQTFFKSIAHRLKQINTNTLYIDLSIYLNLKKCVSKLLFLEQTARLMMINHKFVAQLDQYPCKQVIPLWLAKQINEDQQQDNDIFQMINNCDIYHILHYDTQCEIINLFDQQWMKIQFPENTNIKVRLLLLGLYTYSFKYQGFVYMFQEKELFEDHLIVDERNNLIKKTYHLQSYTDDMINCKIPSKQTLWISNNASEQCNNEVFVRFYKNGIDPKNKKKKNISKLPECQQIERVLYFNSLKNLNYYESLTFIKPVQTASTNVRTITQTDKPKTALQAYVFSQDLIDQDQSNTLDRQLYRLKQVTMNTQKSQHRTKSVNQKQRQKVDLSFLNSTSFNLSTSGVRNNLDYQDFRKQQKYWEDRQVQVKQEVKQKLLQSKQTKFQLQSEKSFYQEFTMGQNLITRHGDRHLLRLRQKKQQSYLQQEIKQQQEQTQHIKEIVKQSAQFKLQTIREKNQQYQNSLVHEEPPIPVIQRHKTKEIRLANKYIHSVLPEEIFPIKIDCENI